jgi:hypothetical protein
MALWRLRPLAGDLIMDDLRNKLDELLGIDEGLTPWEVEFIDNLSHWEGDFTPEQARKLNQIYEDRINNPTH